jgi:hemerythrin
LITQEQLPMVAMPSMNDTHLEEIMIINRLETAAMDNDTEAVRETLKELLEHTTLHFNDEEKRMKKAFFPAYETHKSEHDRHLHELESVQKYFEKHKEPSAITAYIQGNLAPWLIHHIETMDTMTAQFLQTNSAER